MVNLNRKLEGQRPLNEGWQRLIVGSGGLFSVIAFTLALHFSS